MSLASIWRVTFLLLLFPSLAQAHHSYVGTYDANKVITLKGVISAVRFANPHIFITVDVPGRGSWQVETESVAKISAKGLKETHLKEGAKVTVQGWPARNGSPAIGLKAITLPGGKVISIRNTAR